MTYAIQEHSSFKYAPRTFTNARDSDGTMRFAADWESRGELCTLKAINQYKRPYFDIDLLNPGQDSIIRAISWVQEHQIKVLNVAGNSEQTHRGTEKKVIAYLRCLFNSLGLTSPIAANLI